MKTCCFCFDLKGGAIASAIFTLVIYVKAVIGTTIALILINTVYNEERRIEHYPTTLPAVSQSVGEAQYIANIAIGVLLAISAFTVLSCVLLLIGLHKGIRGLFFPWITMMGLKVGACVVSACLLLPLLGIYPYSIVLTLGVLIAGTFYSYMIWCVSSCYNSPAITAVTYQNCGEANRHALFQEEFPHKVEKDTKPLV